MSSDERLSRRGALGVIGATTAALASGCRAQGSEEVFATDTPYSPSETPTGTPTLTRTPRPSATERPTSTATVSPLESVRELEGVSQVHHLGDAWLAYDSQGIPIFEYNQRQGVWEAFAWEEINAPGITIPEYMLAPLSVEAGERQGLRFTSGGEPLPYGYLGYWDFDADSLNPGWYTSSQRYAGGGAVQILFHARFRGLIPGYLQERSGPIPERALLEIPVEREDGATGESYWTGESLYFLVYTLDQNNGPNSIALVGGRLEDRMPRFWSYANLMNVLGSLPVGTSVIIGEQTSNDPRFVSRREARDSALRQQVPFEGYRIFNAGPLTFLILHESYVR